MDPVSESDILGRIITLLKGKTLIVITHRMSFLEKFDRVYVIQNGTITSNENHQDAGNF